MPPRLTNREKRLAAVTMVLAGLALTYWSVISPAWDRCIALDRLVTARRVDLARMQSYWLRRERIDAEYALLVGNVAGASNLDQEIAAFARSVDALYKGRPLQVQSVRLLPSVDLAVCQKLVLMVELEGSMLEIVGFLDAVGRSKEPMRVEEIRISCRSQPDVVRATFHVTKAIINAT